MSNAALTWIRNIPFRGAKKAVLFSIADAVNEAGLAWPSTSVLAFRSGITRRHLIRVLVELEQDRIITVSRRNGAPSTYQLHMDWQPTCDMVSLVEVNVTCDMVSSTCDMVSDDAPQTCDMVSSTCDMVSPKALEAKERKRSPLSQTRVAAREPVDDAFVEFWLAYPRKVGKGQAVKAFRTAAKKIPPAQIIAAVIAYPFDLSRPEYIPHASTWLNGERWADEIDTRDPVLVAVGYYDKDPPELDLSPPPRGVLVS